VAYNTHAMDEKCVYLVLKFEGKKSNAYMHEDNIKIEWFRQAV
jgi:hypothetical protein